MVAVAGIIAPLYLIAMLGYFAYGLITGAVRAAALPDNPFGWLAVCVLIYLFLLGLYVEYTAIKRRYASELS